MRVLGATTAVQVAAAAILFAASPATAQNLETTFGRSAAGSTMTVDHSTWDRLLKAHVVESPDGINRLSYAKFKKDGHKDLKGYIAQLEKVDVAKLDRPEQFAFWANLYNAKTIDVVLDKYPIKSIKDINLGGSLLTVVTGGPWKAKIMKVGGVDLSLDDVEHAIMRPVFKDPRVHYADNCASIGCPNLMAEAFTGAKLQQQLDAGAKAYVNHVRGIAVAGGKIKASSIYSWFQADFGGSAQGVLEHVRKFAEPALKQKLEGITTIGDFDYDWNLNEVKG